jgi:hypothetical protein
MIEYVKARLSTSRGRILAGTGALLLIGAVQAQAQMTTERFIPIGKSPGLSGTYTWIGGIAAVDQSARTVTVRGSSGEERTVRITDSTHIWVDRSAVQETNTIGSLTDLQVGRRAEVKYLDRELREIAEWIKVASGSDEVR